MTLLDAVLLILVTMLALLADLVRRDGLRAQERAEQHLMAREAAWTIERNALVQQLSGVSVAPAPMIEPERPRRQYGTDADEWAVERRRRGLAGTIEP